MLWPQKHYFVRMNFEIFLYLVLNIPNTQEMENFRKSQFFTAQKLTFSIKDFFCKFLQLSTDLVTFTEEILNGKPNFLCNATIYHGVLCLCSK